MNILTDYLTGLSLLLARTALFGLSWWALIIGSFLLVLIIMMIVRFFRLLYALFRRPSHEYPEYSLLGKADRELYSMASMILHRAEYSIGGEARTCVRNIPGIVIDDDGAFRSLGEIPFEGLLAVASTLRKKAGLLVLIPLLSNRDTRRVLHIISLF